MYMLICRVGEEMVEEIMGDDQVKSVALTR